VPEQTIKAVSIAAALHGNAGRAAGFLVRDMNIVDTKLVNAGGGFLRGRPRRFAPSGRFPVTRRH
jgi:hypothetical protein